MSHAISSRRAFLRAALTLPAGAMLAACIAPTSPPPAPAPSVEESATLAPTAQPIGETDTVAAESTQPTLEPTLACGDDDDEPTFAQTEGPYYTPNTPERTSFLEAGMPGRELLLSGFVLNTDCTPVARALVDFWHCDNAGNYDNVGYTLRGHQFTDDQGRYELTSIVPGLYPGRTRHIHVKVQAPNESVLTTQLYFPDEPANANDGIFHPSLLVETSEQGEAMNALFTFVLA
jgi:protocatechuate 3,4-dioxygenase beta subunit